MKSHIQVCQLKKWKRSEIKYASIADTSNVEEANELFEEVEDLFYRKIYFIGSGMAD